jgi:hypothetical protein
MIITGHTSNIGKAIYDKYPALGLSRTNGYDINDTMEIIDIIRKNNPKVFINNAYSGIAQSNILLGIYENNLSCKVISMGSMSVYRQDAKSKAQIQYSSDKLHLKHTHEHLKRNGFNSVLIELGMVDTSYNKDKDVKKVSIEEVLRIMHICLTENIDIVRVTPLTKVNNP